MPASVFKVKSGAGDPSVWADSGPAAVRSVAKAIEKSCEPICTWSPKARRRAPGSGARRLPGCLDLGYCNIGLRSRGVKACRSQGRAVVLPLHLQLVHERDEARIAPDVVEIRVSREVGVAGPAGLRRLPEPVESAARLVQQGVHRRDVVRGVMKMDVSLSLHEGGPDILLRPRRISRLGEQHGARARDYATGVIRVHPQVALHERGRFVVPAEIEQGPGNLIVPEGLVGLGRDLADQA